ncbi:MAG TPA: hypothetical protein VGL64_19085 [Amycolatopsis sp.]
MTDQTGGDQPQKTVAELLAQHGQQVDGGRRRRRRAADDDEAPETTGTGGSRRAPNVTDTAPQAIIDRVTSDGGTPPPPSRTGSRRRPDGPPPSPRAVPQESQPLPRPSAPPPGRPVNGQQDSGYVRPPAPPQESGQFARPPAPPQESGQFARPQDSGYVRPPAPPQESGQFARPPQESAPLPVPPRGRAPRQQPPGPPPAAPPQAPPPLPADETRDAVQPIRHRPPPAPPAPQNSSLTARLDGLDGTPDADVPEPPAGPGAMASGAFPTGAPQRPRRAPARRPAPKQEPHTEQFDAVADRLEPEPPAAAPPQPQGPGPAQQPAGLAGWRKRRQQEQLEDTEIGVMPVVPGEAGTDDGYADDDYADDDYVDDGYQDDNNGYPAPDNGYPPADNGYPAADKGYAPEQDYDAGPPTSGYPPPMPFAPGRKDDRHPLDDDLSEYEREFEQPAYADGPDFERDDYGYEQQSVEYEDDYDDEEDGAEAPAEEPAPEGSPGKQWLTLAGQLALGVVGGAGVWLGFNWLWVNLAPAALVGALLVIVALVWIVRKIRRAEDLQTTVLALLVGLVVTVSPAALLLVAR